MGVAQVAGGQRSTEVEMTRSTLVMRAGHGRALPAHARLSVTS